jgi:hypothetical protein
MTEVIAGLQLPLGTNQLRDTAAQLKHLYRGFLLTSPALHPARQAPMHSGSSLLQPLAVAGQPQPRFAHPSIASG